MNNSLAVLKSSTAVASLTKRDADGYAAGLQLLCTVTTTYGKADISKLAAKLSQQPNLDQQTLRAVEARLTPVQKGELARLRDASPADKSSPVPVTTSNSALALTQDRLTPVQQGELARNRALRPSSDTAIEQQNILLVGHAPLTIDPSSNPGAADDGVVPRPRVYPPASKANETRTHRELHERGGPHDFSVLFGPTADDKLDPITGASDVNSKLPWAVEFKKSPIILKAYTDGLIKGVSESALGTAKGLASVFQYAEDHIISPGAFDHLRSATGKLPKWLDSILPSASRGREEDVILSEIRHNIGDYIHTRRKDPSLLKKDISDYFTNNWNKLAAEHAKVRAQGQEQEAKWWGEKTGSAIYETAMTLLTAADAAKFAGKLISGARTAFTAFGNLSARGTVAAPADVANLADSLEVVRGAASRLTTNGNISDTGLANLKSTLDELNDIHPQTFGLGSEAERATDLLADTRLQVADAIESGYRLSAPGKKPRIETPSERQARINDLAEHYRYNPPEDNPDFSAGMNRLRNLPKNGTARITGDAFINVEDLSKLTKDRGHEYALFEIIRNGKVEQIVVRGDEHTIDFKPGFIETLKKFNPKLIAHTHATTGTRPSEIGPSAEDLQLLKALGQKESLILNSNGHAVKFNDVGNFEKYVEITDAAKFREKTKGKLTPNATYTYKGLNPSGETFSHSYKTDAKGRVVEADGNLVGKGATDRSTGSTGTAVGHTGIKGKAFGENDVGFHLFGDQFLGADARINFVAGNESLNNGPFKSLETALRTKADSGAKVNMKISLKYNDDLANTLPNLPDRFIVEYTIDGRKYTETFENKNPNSVPRAKQKWEG